MEIIKSIFFPRKSFNKTCISLPNFRIFSDLVSTFGEFSELKSVSCELEAISAIVSDSCRFRNRRLLNSSTPIRASFSHLVFSLQKKIIQLGLFL